MPLRPAVHHPILANVYDIVLHPTEVMGVRRLRARLVKGLDGSILEIGVGTGLNLPHYAHEVILHVIDPDPSMLARASRRGARAPIPVHLYLADAHHLPFADGAFDAAVIGFALCTIPDPELALREAHRVVRPGGTLRFLEHVRSKQRRTAQWQDRLSPVWFRVAGGCRLNQETAGILEDSHWEVETLWRSDGGSVIAGQAVRI